MANTLLEEFLREKKAKAMPDADRSAERAAWIAAVGALYDTIENEYLATAKDSVAVDRSRTKAISEPSIGSYSIAELTLAVGDEQVVFSPKGLKVIGASGRVDVRGDRGEATLVRQSDGRWMLVAARTPKLQLIPLTDAAFLDMLRSVMR